tara:strand:- start:458 stop:613 length:156 start_codon:yes stop_codon:yes gene_type:complete
MANRNFEKKARKSRKDATFLESYGNTKKVRSARSKASNQKWADAYERMASE